MHLPYYLVNIARLIFIITATLFLSANLAQANTDKPTLSNFLGMEFVQIPAGRFLMGSPESEAGRDLDETQHPVTISQDFYIQTTEVTRKQWKAIMGDDPSGFKSCGDDCPVDRLQWGWIQLFLKNLNEQDLHYNYRLPTEAEWEYVARAGTQTAFYTGDCLAANQANIRADKPYSDCITGQRSTSPTPVASFAPNAWGVYDMHGNAWEMCSDWYGNYPTTAVTDPKGPKEGKYKVLRGASWFYPVSFARSANRFKNLRDIGGFRLVAELKAATDISD